MDPNIHLLTSCWGKSTKQLGANSRSKSHKHLDNMNVSNLLLWQSIWWCTQHWLNIKTVHFNEEFWFLFLKTDRLPLWNSKRKGIIFFLNSEGQAEFKHPYERIVPLLANYLYRITYHGKMTWFWWKNVPSSLQLSFSQAHLWSLL